MIVSRIGRIWFHRGAPEGLHDRCASILSTVRPSGRAVSGQCSIRRRFHPDEGYHCAAVSDSRPSGSSRSWGRSLGCRSANPAVTMELGWKRWLSVFVAATILAGGLASIFHRDTATLLPQQSSDRCSGVCPCGTI
jgi:hypothetical protein